MILTSQKSMWSFQWFIILLFNRVRYSPTSIRRWYRIVVDVIPLRVSSSGFPSFKVETVQSHHSRVIVFNLNVPILRQISQTQIWDPRLLRLKQRIDPLAEDGETRRANLILYIVDWASNFSGGVLDDFEFCLPIPTGFGTEIIKLIDFAAFTNVTNLRLDFSRPLWITILEEEDVSMIQSPESVYKLTSPTASTLVVYRFDPLRLAVPDSITNLWVGWIHLTTITILILKTSLVENLRFKHLLPKRCLLFCLMVTGAYPFLRTRTTLYGEIDIFFLAFVMVEETIRRRTRRISRSNQQYVWVYGTITNNHISFFRRVPTSMVLRCNGWIADFDFRKRKRWCIDKKKMFPKLESHTRLTDKTKATKHIIRIAALELFCFFVTKICDCAYTLMFNNVICGSH